MRHSVYQVLMAFFRRKPADAQQHRIAGRDIEASPALARDLFADDSASVCVFKKPGRNAVRNDGDLLGAHALIFQVAGKRVTYSYDLIAGLQ